MGLFLVVLFFVCVRGVAGGERVASMCVVVLLMTAVFRAPRGWPLGQQHTTGALSRPLTQHTRLPGKSPNRRTNGCTTPRLFSTATCALRIFDAAT